MGNQVPRIDADVTLREVTRDTVWVVCNLHVSKEQEQFVAPNAFSIAQAYFSREAWFRAIYADETPVGFVMLKQVPERGSYCLWRFMIDERYQKKGYGKRALQLIIEHVRSMPRAEELTLSYHKGEGSPQPFYEKLGFRDTGRMINSEYEMKLKL
jgi:diamine N-acetyltransferase